MPADWDQTMFYAALQAVRCDPSCSHGYAPAEILLGRKLVFPIELKKMEIDFTGTELTQPLVAKIMSIHNEVFGVASKKIGEYQAKYKKKYDKKHSVKKFTLKRGSRVQVQIHRSKRAKGSGGLKWQPRKGFYIISKVDRQKKKCVLKTIDGRVLKRSTPFDRIRKVPGIY